MKYRSLKDLATAAEISRYSLDSAIKVGVIREEWIYRSPTGGHRKIYTQCFDHCLAALNQGWAPRINSQPPAVEIVSADSEEARTGISLEELAKSAGCTLQDVLEAIADGSIPESWLIEIDGTELHTAPRLKR